MPNKRYLTLLDKFVMCNIFFVVAVFVEVAVVELVGGKETANEFVGESDWTLGDFLLLISFLAWVIMNVGFALQSYAVYIHEKKKLVSFKERSF